MVSTLLSPPTFLSVPLPSAPVTRFNIDVWRASLQGWYRDPEDLLSLIRHGVSLGYSGERPKGYIVNDNHPSATNDPVAVAAIDKEMVDELTKRRMAGPFTLAQIRLLFEFLRTSPMAAVPKPDGERRIIDDLTNGDDPNAVNAHISDEEAHVRYHPFDDAMKIVQRLGRGCLLAKIDWRAAFRQIAVCREDWPLLGLSWRGHIFIRLVLPFGARSSPQRFTRFAEAFAGILRRVYHIQHLTFYLDDSLLGGAPGTDECRIAMETFDKVALEHGVETHPVKRDGPTTCLTYLGIGIDTVAMRVFLPRPKQEKLIRACAELIRARSASLNQLDSVIGLMLFAARVVQPGRIMARRVIELKRTYSARAPHVQRALPEDAIADLEWWRDNLAFWDGRSIIPQTWEWAEPIVVQSDACTSDGAGAVYIPIERSGTAARSWLYYRWPHGSDARTWPIAVLELAAVAIALATWGSLLQGRKVSIHSDSMNAVNAVERTATTNALSMRLLRGIHALAFEHDFHVKITHIKGTHNVRADAVSRLSFQDPSRLQELGLRPGDQVQPTLPHWLDSLITSGSSSSASASRNASKSS